MHSVLPLKRELVRNTLLHYWVFMVINKLLFSRILQDLLLIGKEISRVQDRRSQIWFLVPHSARWMGIRLDFVCTLFVAVATFTGVFTTTDAGNITKTKRREECYNKNKRLLTSDRTQLIKGTTAKGGLTSSDGSDFFLCKTFLEYNFA